MITIGDAVLWLSADRTKYNHDLKDAERKATGWVSTVGDIVKNGMGTALGFITRDLIGGVVRGFQDMAVAALDSVASYERLGLSLETLVTRELMRGQTVEKVSQQVVNLTDAEKAKIGELTDAYRLKEIAIAKTQSEIDAILAKGADANNLAIEERQIRIRALQGDMAELRGEIDKLQSKDGQLVDVIKQVTVGQLSHAEAMAQAAPKAKELLGWIVKLSVLSPFKQSEVADAFQQAMAYGFTADQAKRLTTALINFAAGAGKSGDTMNRIALALGQIQAKGKLAGQEVLQLVNAGLPVTEILAKAFNKTTAEIEEMRENGLIKADDAIKAIIETLETDFAGAAERQATSWAGLTSTISDIKELGLREFFTGTFAAIQPYAEGFVNLFTEGDMLERLRQMGEALGQNVAKGLEWVGSAAELVRERWNGFMGMIQAGYDPIDAAAVVLKSLVPENLRGFIDDVAGAIKDLRDRAGEAWEKLQPVRDALQGVFDAIKNNDPEALGKAVGELFGAIGSSIGPALEPVKTLLGQWIGDAFKDVSKKANDWGGEMWDGFQEGLKRSLDLTWLSQAITKPFEDAKQWMMTNAPELFAGLLTAMVVLGAVWNAALLVLGPAWDAFIKSVSNSWEQYLKPVFDALLPYGGYLLAFIGGALLLLVGIVVGVMNGIVTALNWASPFIALFLMGIGNIVAGIIDVFMGLGMFIYKLFTGDIPGAFQELGTSFQGLIEIVVGLVGTIIGIIGGAIALITGFVWGFITGIIDFFRYLYDELVGHSIIPDMLQAMIDAFTKKFAEIIKNAKTFVDDVIKAFTDQFENFKTLGQSLMDHVWKGVSMKIAQFIDGISGFVRDAISEAGKVLGEVNPFADGVPGGDSGSGTKPTKFAAGGRYQANVPRIVGENGPELDIPDRGGNIIPNGGLLGLLANAGQKIFNINITNVVPDDVSIELTAQRTVEIIKGIA